MEPKASVYIPQVFRSFQGFAIKDIKEWRDKRRMELILESKPEREHFCGRCGCDLGRQDGRYWLRSHHLRVMGWTVTVCFWREKRFCPACNKVRSEAIDFICQTTPHATEELAWWINRLTEITSVLAVSRLESIDKMTCYGVDKYILTRLLQGYKIPKVTAISVDEVYARGPKQLKEGETRDDLFLTVIVDSNTHKVIWVSKSRRRDGLDEFFQLIGEEACKEIKVVATDQHDGYAASVSSHAPQAVVVWDKFHLVQKFNEALNEDRKQELERIDPEGAMGDLMNGKYRYVFLTKAKNRKTTDIRHIEEVHRLNSKMAKLELIKEHFHKMFDCQSAEDAKIMMAEIYQWAWDAKAEYIWSWVNSIRNEARFWNYFYYRVTTGVSEGINRAIKGLKWQAYGYKDMDYFSLKILQKCGYLNSRYYMTADK
jgi:transposase